MEYRAKTAGVPFALLGYICAAYFKMPIIGIALVGAVFAIKHYNESSNVAAAAASAGGAQEVEHDDWI